jgi:hypothetical protein
MPIVFKHPIDKYRQWAVAFYNGCAYFRTKREAARFARNWRPSEW